MAKKCLTQVNLWINLASQKDKNLNELKIYKKIKTLWLVTDGYELFYQKISMVLPLRI